MQPQKLLGRERNPEVLVYDVATSKGGDVGECAGMSDPALETALSPPGKHRTDRSVITRRAGTGVYTPVRI